MRDKYTFTAYHFIASVTATSSVSSAFTAYDFKTNATATSTFSESQTKGGATLPR